MRTDIYLVAIERIESNRSEDGTWGQDVLNGRGFRGQRDAGLPAFITHSADIWQILEHVGVESEPPLLESSAVRLHGNVAGVDHGTTGFARESSRVAGRAPAL